MLSKLFKHLRIYNRKLKYKKVSYSFNAYDLITDYIFKNKVNGIYIDIVAHHLILNNNSYLLFQSAWRGINIDLDKMNIANNYHFVNWLHGDLVFVHNDFRD